MAVWITGNYIDHWPHPYLASLAGGDRWIRGVALVEPKFEESLVPETVAAI